MKYIKFLLVFHFMFWSHHEARGILFLQPGVEPTHAVLEVWSPNHWTTGTSTTLNFYNSPALQTTRPIC